MKNLVPGARIPTESIHEHHKVSEGLFQTQSLHVPPLLTQSLKLFFATATQTIIDQHHGSN